MDTIQLVARDACETGNDYNGEMMGARISSVFVILVTSGFGAFFPILSSKYSFIRLPPMCFFIAKYFGSGVIVATAFIHLLQPANESLSDDCLGGTFAEYPWAFAICLMTLFVLFFFELMAYKFVESKTGDSHIHSHFGEEDLYVKHTGHVHSHDHDHGEDEEDDDDDHKGLTDADKEVEFEGDGDSSHENISSSVNPQGQSQSQSQSQLPSHFSHAKEHQNMEVIGTPGADMSKETYYGQLLNIFVLEFGIVFHSVFVGIALAVSGEEFKTLYIVVVFHQCFEGLGLGTRIATTPWDKSRRHVPYIMALAYCLTTPVAIAIGLGVRHSYPSNSYRALVTNGCFDAISAGILLYTGLIELMAHEFLYGDEFKGKGGLKKMIIAYIVMCWGCGLMALLGKWA